MAGKRPRKKSGASDGGRAPAGGDITPPPKPKKNPSNKGPKGKPVVIVESPAKAKTINKILGSGFVVKACMGHVRDLPERKFGINVERQFEPTYQTIKNKTRIVSELRSAT